MSISKLLKITLSAFLLAQTVWAQTVVNIPRGNSFTALLVFNSSYNPSRIDDISVWVGSKSWGTLGEGKVKTTANARQFRVEITSDETRNYTGRNEFIVSVKDSVLGVRKVIAGVLNFTEAGRYSGAVVSTGVDWTISINITSAGIASNATLATIFKGDKGDKGDTGAQGATGATGAQGIQGVTGAKGDKGDTGATGPAGANAQNPNFSVATGTAGSNVSVSGSYPNLTLTIPRGDTGATGAAGSDASVTSGNIASALGYTPVSPTQLGTKRDTSASITTSKISDWTAAWAARFAAQSTSNLAEGTNLYHTTARVQAVGDARYLPLTGGILTNASTYQLRLAYDASNHATFTVGSNGSLTISPSGTSPIIFRTNNTEAARFHSDGNFSIGNNVNTGYKWDVNGTARIQGNTLIGNTSTAGQAIYLQASTYPFIYAQNSLTGYTTGDGLRIGYEANVYAMIDQQENKPLVIRTNAIERLRITETGDITATRDVEINDSTKGLILKSPNGTRYRITIENDGTLTRTAL